MVLYFWADAKTMTVLRDYTYPANEAILKQAVGDEDWAAAFEELARPLHEALYIAGNFDFIDTLTPAERLVLALDYVQMQVGQGGFIQLIQNGYVSLLVSAIEAAQAEGVAAELGKTLDDALKVFVLNNEALSRETSPQEFAKLYEEFKEFESLDAAFNSQVMNALEAIVNSIIIS